jgi:hypothetical protein
MNHWVLVTQDAPNTHVGSVEIPEDVRHVEMCGIVEDLGAGCNYPLTLTGCRVWWGENADVLDVQCGGETYVLVKEEDLLCVEVSDAVQV